MVIDDALTRVRKTRKHISDVCDNDPEKLVKYYQKKQKRHKKRLVHPDLNSVREDRANYK
jgi:hypothetical protein